MNQRPAKIEILTSLREIAPGEWDRLAQASRTCEKAGFSSPLSTDADSLSQSHLGAELESISQLRNGQIGAQAPPESTPETPESLREHAESPYEEDKDNPFISHAFLNALEESHSVGEGTGWTPFFMLAKAQTGEILGALPAYAKSHSRGEYVFDHTFAEAYHRYGMRYYPKLQISVPFTPARAGKLLIAPEADETATRAALLDGVETLRARLNASSIHATFLTTADQASFAQAGYLAREDRQFHFLNRGYVDFEAFLAALSSRKRKVIKRERREALESGIEIERLTGDAITPAHWDAFFAFYIDTGNRKWGTPYLTRAFFTLVGARMADRILLVMAKREGRYIAGALNFIGGNTLYGRHWGAIEHHPFLHFELCYHQAIEFALSRGLRRVEAGAQGEHKLARGYEPVATCSAHTFSDSRFQEAIADYLLRERAAVRAMGEEMAEFMPFKRTSLP
jgi:uncharacterized protein